MNDLTESSWYVVGYLRAVPDGRAFVFPVLQNADAINKKAYFAIHGRKLDFFEPQSDEALIRITPTIIPKTSDLKDALPLYGYEFELGKVWIGDARQMAKILIDFSCESSSISARERKEIAAFIERVVTQNEFIPKNSVIIEGHSTFAEGLLTSQLEVPLNRKTNIKVIGIGGGGGNAVEYLTTTNVSGVDFIVANTDFNALSNTPTIRTLRLGTAGLGCGGNPARGYKAALESEREIYSLLTGTDMLILVASLGGGTGTGATPVFARIARELGILTVSIVTTPFYWEGEKRVKIAANGVAELESHSDALIEYSNELLLSMSPDDLSQEDLFKIPNQALRDALQGIVSITNEYGNVNVDFDDIRTVLTQSGRAIITSGVAQGPDRAMLAVERALSAPIVRSESLTQASGILILVSADKSALKLSESRLAMKEISKLAAPDAHLIYGAGYDDSLGDSIRVSIIATGFRGAVQKPEMHEVAIVQSRAVIDERASAAQNARNEMLGGIPGVPSIWRTSRTNLASKTDPLASGGMDDFEIPYFLRRHAD